MPVRHHSHDSVICVDFMVTNYIKTGAVEQPTEWGWGATLAMECEK